MTSRAKLQLVDAARWWATHRSAEQAARWLDGFEQSLAQLSNDPERHPLARENDLYDLPYTVRQLLYGIGARATHRAVFEIREDTVYVIAIRHLAQTDLPSELL
ncbi:MAG TPA: type II toxin-antitoxin system RelE/ParE family toxin [Pirellulales bacterium]|nr:type II toxin-antitoxin system RelE/ParE family toxin [Pirellulales bacterium]